VQVVRLSNEDYLVAVERVAGNVRSAHVLARRGDHEPVAIDWFIMPSARAALGSTGSNDLSHVRREQSVNGISDRDAVAVRDHPDAECTSNQIGELIVREESRIGVSREPIAEPRGLARQKPAIFRNAIVDGEQFEARLGSLLPRGGGRIGRSATLEVRHSSARK
jgi:hypothetical protein